jgi:hypothetical protein
MRWHVPAGFPTTVSGFSIIWILWIFIFFHVPQPARPFAPEVGSQG